MTPAEVLGVALAAEGTPWPERAARLLLGVARAMCQSPAAAAVDARQLLDIARQRPGLVRGALAESCAAQRVTMLRKMAEAGAEPGELRLLQAREVQP